MKKSLIFILILALPFISSLTVDMKSSYNQGETIIAGISGNIVDPIQEANIIFYRGHVQIPMDYDVARIGENFYVKASLLGKTSGDYSMRIENIHYYKSGFLTNEPVTTNFSINSTILIESL